MRDGEHAEQQAPKVGLCTDPDPTTRLDDVDRRAVGLEQIAHVACMSSRRCRRQDCTGATMGPLVSRSTRSGRKAGGQCRGIQAQAHVSAATPPRATRAAPRGGTGRWHPEAAAHVPAPANLCACNCESWPFFRAVSAAEVPHFVRYMTVVATKPSTLSAMSRPRAALNGVGLHPISSSMMNSWPSSP